MSTSYTGTLKLGKPAAGDTGWGNTLNGEVTDMVEEAISGMSTINTWGVHPDAANTHTLSSANGTTSESRAAILRLTDTTSDIAGGATGIVIVPDNTKLYCIINETGHTVTVKTASGTGISIPTAVQANVVCNGTNVVEQTNYNSAFIAALAEVDTLKITAGGTGITAFVDEDNMASNSATAIASQQSIKAYVDNNATYHRQANYFAWDVPTFSGSVSGSSLPKFDVADNTTATVVEFELLRPSPATASRHKIDITLVGDKDYPWTGATVNAGFQVNANIVCSVQRKSKSATGTTIGTNSVAQAQLGGGNSNFLKIYVTGDVTNELDSFSWIAKSASPASNAKYQVLSYEYEIADDRTSIVYNGNSNSSTAFVTTGNNVFVSNTGFTPIGDYHSATFGSGYSSSVPFYTANIGTFFAAYQNNFQAKTGIKDVIPSLVVKPESVGTIEMRIQITCGILSSNGEYSFRQATIDQTTIGRD